MNFVCVALSIIFLSHPVVPVELQIQVNPPWDSHPPGYRLTFLCYIVRGDLPVRFNLLHPNDRQSTYFTAEFVTLDSDDKYGTYTCNGTNRFGNHSSSLTIAKPGLRKL